MNGNHAAQIYRNQETQGKLTPQPGASQGSLSKPCTGLPAKVNAQSILALINAGVQDINTPQNRQCAENSTQAKGDESASHLLSTIPVFSGNPSSAG